MSSEGNRVVVIGGGIGGSLVAKILQSTADVTLIDPKDFFEISWGNMRAIVEPAFAERSIVHHTEYLTKGKIVTSHAAQITDTEVLTVDGDQVPYDYLVIATGLDIPFPRTREARLKQFQADHEKVQSADSVLIVGGGPTGVELAAEIAVDFPKKKVTLVHKGSRLVEFVSPKASKKVLDWLVSKKVEVILGQSVDLNDVSTTGEKTTYRTSNGEVIVADCHFLCAGKPVGPWLRGTAMKESLDSRGRVMVDANVRVKGRKNIFAIGDITDIPEIKQGYLAQAHAKVAAKNIELLMSKGDESKMAVYTPPKGDPVALISLGRKEALAQFPFMTVCGWLPGLLKSKDLFVVKVRTIMELDGVQSENQKSGIARSLLIVLLCISLSVALYHKGFY